MGMFAGSKQGLAHPPGYVRGTSTHLEVRAVRSIGGGPMVLWQWFWEGFGWEPV